MADEQMPGFPAPAGMPPRYDDSQPPPARPESDAPPDSAPPKQRLWLHALLFVATAISMEITALPSEPLAKGESALKFAAYQAVSLLGILVIHELGHYVASRLHRVPASLPFFVPLPMLGLFGTMGAVITMRDRIRSRKALLDIGAAGPIAGMVVAIPVMMVGLSMSRVEPQSTGHYIQEGQSILYWLLKRLVLGPIPPGHDVILHPMAFAGWGGFFLTMINLLPWGQLDGGHIAYALFGNRQYVFARWVRRALLLVCVYNLISLGVPILLGRSHQPWWSALEASAVWLIWYGVTGLMGRFFGEDHPPFEEGELGSGRKLVAVGCLVLFVLLFLPTPIAIY
jgi:membrane-associated protease RseP (regulator of RpoE activity)